MFKTYDRSSGVLLYPLIPEVDLGADQIYIQARVALDKFGRVTMDVDKEIPSVVANEKVRSDLGLDPTLSLVKDVQKQFETSPYWLISPGVCFWACYADRPPEIILAEKDQNSSAPGELTDAAGRCNRPFPDCLSNEGHEEQLILYRPDRRSPFSPVVIAGTNYLGGSPLALKARQIAEKEAQLSAMGIPLSSILTNTAAFGNFCVMPHEKNLSREILFVAPSIQTPPFRAMCFFDAAHNTVEIRKSVAIDVARGGELIVIDGERFNRKSRLFTLAALQAARAKGSLKTRPGLSSYLSSVSTGVRPSFVPKPVKPLLKDNT